MQPQSGGSASMSLNKTNSHLLLIIVLATLLVFALIFGIWAFSGQQDYKNNADKKIANAVAAAKTAEDAKQQLNFADQLKSPYKTFTSSTFGSISFNYPKSYSAYVDQTNTSEPLNAYFHPLEVPGATSGAAFALRVELVTTAYKDVLSQFSSTSTGGKAKVTPYVPPKMVGVKDVQTGSRIDGVVDQGTNGNSLTGSMVIIPLRDKTLQIYTESTDFLSDFNNIVLPSLVFVP